MTRLLLVFVIGMIASVAGAVEDRDRLAGRDAIAGQIDAFRRDDAAAAYGFAAPGIQSMFGNDQAFLDMVRRAYPPVHRPRSYEFGAVRDDGEGFEQAVAIQDEAGIDWDAVYTFEKQPDGSWRISACRLVKRPGEAA